MFLSYLRIALIPLFMTSAHADTSGRCRAPEADRSMESLATWRDLRVWWEMYPNCDDGDIGEGLSVTVEELLANDWSTLPRLRKELLGRPRFRRFVLDHIDATNARED